MSLILLFDFHHEYTATPPSKRTRAIVDEDRGSGIIDEERRRTIGSDGRIVDAGSGDRIRVVTPDGRTSEAE